MADEKNDLPAIPEIPADLGALDNETLTGLHAELQAAYEANKAARGERPTADHKKHADEVRAAQKRIVTEMTDRIEIANDLRATDDVDVSLPEPVVAETPAEEVAPDAPAEGDETPAETPAEGEQVPDQALAPATAAALTPAAIAANRDGAAQTPPDANPDRPKMALVAAAGTPAQGAELDFEGLGRLLNANRTGPNNRTMLASVGSFQDAPDIGAEMLDVHNSTIRNDEIIRDAVQSHMAAAWPETHGQTQAQTASICTPYDIIREIPDCVEASEPFSDNLPGRPAGRLGFQYTPSMSITDFDSAVDVWTEADQDAVVAGTASTWKPCVFVDCPTPLSVTAEAITACFYADNTTDMSNPERVRDAMSKLAARRARLKAGRLIQLADTFSHNFLMTGPYGALPGFVEAILSTLPQGKYFERLEDGAPYIAFTSPGLIEALVIDQTNVGFLSAEVLRDVQDFVRERAAAAGWNLRLVPLNDVGLSDAAPFIPLPAVNGAAVGVPGLGGSLHPFHVRLIAPEAALYFSTGEINMGVERSPELNRRNQFQFFAEEYVGLAKHGCHPWHKIRLTLCDNGGRAGTVTPFTCTERLT